MERAILRRAWSEVSTVMVSEMKSGPSIRQMVMRAPAFLGLPAEGERERMISFHTDPSTQHLHSLYTNITQTCTSRSAHSQLIKGEGSGVIRKCRKGTKCQRCSVGVCSKGVANEGVGDMNKGRRVFLHCQGTQKID